MLMCLDHILRIPHFCENVNAKNRGKEIIKPSPTAHFSQNLVGLMFFYVNSMKSIFFLIFGIDFMENLS
jgi:hypothetical protein